MHSVVYGGFASHELSNRIDHCTPKVVITASCGVEPTRIVPYKPILNDALELSKHKIEKAVVVQRHNIEECEMTSLDVDYDDLMKTRTLSMALCSMVVLPSCTRANLLALPTREPFGG